MKKNVETNINFVMEISFDEASHEWRKNKISRPMGMFQYRCEHIIGKTKNPCKKAAISHSDYCWVHQKMKNTINK